jgi:hypothetical protein
MKMPTKTNVTANAVWGEERSIAGRFANSWIGT